MKKLLITLTFLGSVSTFAENWNENPMKGTYKLIDGTELTVDGAIKKCSSEIEVEQKDNEISITHIHSTKSSFPTIFDKDKPHYGVNDLKEGCRKVSGIPLETMAGKWETCKTISPQQVEIVVSGLNPGFDAFYGRDTYTMKLNGDLLKIEQTHLMKDQFICTYEKK